MGHAILYCTGCSTQLREPDFDRGAAFRFDGRVYCSKCAPEEARAQAPPVPPSTAKIPKIAPPVSTARLKVPDEAAQSTKWPLIAGGVLVGLGLLLALMFSGKDSPRPAAEPQQPVVEQKPDLPPVLKEKALLPPPPPPTNEKEAEEAILRARQHAKANPDDLAGQLALYDEAVRVTALTGHSAAAAREREAVQTRLKGLVKSRLDALDASVKSAADREEFGAALKLLSEARAEGLGTEWTTELDLRSGKLRDSVGKLFPTVKADAVNAQNRTDEPEVRRLTERVDKWGMPAYKTELARAVAAAAAPKKPPPPPKALEAYRKKWTEAMGDAGFRDFPAALKKIEEASAGQADAAVQAEAAADLELIRQAISSEEEAIQLVAKIPKGQKATLIFNSEAGRKEMTGTVVRNENHEIELAGEKGVLRIPIGEIATRVLGQTVREKRQDAGPSVLCLMDGDVQAAKSLAEGAPALAEKYWSFKPPSNGPSQAAARRLFYSAERDLRSHARVGDALQKYATLLKDHATTEFVRRNRALIALRAETTPREFYFMFEDFRVGPGLRSFRGEKDEPYWKTLADAKGGENVVELGFYGLADTEYRCWVYVGACCAEILSCAFQVLEGEEALGEPAPVKLPSMQYKTHEAHSGRGRPVSKWGWAQVPLPKFTAAGGKRVRISAPMKGFSAAEALVSATRPGLPTNADFRELERIRIEARGSARVDPSLVGYWKLDGSAADSGPYGIDGKLTKGSWHPGSANPPTPPSLKLDGTGGVSLGTNLTQAQAISACTISAWICPDRIGTAENEQFVILSLSRYNNGAPTPDSRVYLSMLGSGTMTVGARAWDNSRNPASLKTTEKVAKVGVWMHVAGVIDIPSDSITIYVNGMPQAATGTVKFGMKSTPNTPSANAAIGSDDDGRTQFFKGYIADVRLYTRALGKEEIAELATPLR
jgi:hypothetical protein